MKRIIIDADPGIDDTLAILFALGSKELKVEGITTVNGNCNLENATRNTFRILDLVERKDVPVYKGASKPLKISNKDAEDVHGENGFGGVEYPEIPVTPQKESAAEYLTKMVKENPNEIIVVALGPLTNIAEAIQKDDTFSKNVKELVIMGGSASEGNHSKYAEFNFWNDPDAAKIVFEAGFKSIFMGGLDVTRKMIFTLEQQEKMKKRNTKISDLLYGMLKQYNKFQWEVQGIKGSIINDPITITYILKPEIMEMKDCYVSIVTEEGEQLGRSIVDIEGKEHEGKTNAKVAFDIDVDAFFELMFSKIFSEGLGDGPSKSL